MTPLELAAEYPRLRVVESFAELIATPFAEGVNALCWPRVLAGDFGEVVTALGDVEGIMALEEERLRGLKVSAAGVLAIEVMLGDLGWLRESGREPELNCLQSYPRDEAGAGVSTDVYSFHADSAPVESETWLCTYFGRSSEGLRNEEARRRVDLPETRAALLREFDGEEGVGFREYLRECCYDLHYAPLPGARPFSFGVSNLWRVAVEYPGAPVPPCIHRAPATVAGDRPRLLLIS